MTHERLVDFAYQIVKPGCRMSSKLFPWCTEWEFEDLPNKDLIKEQLAFVGRAPCLASFAPSAWALVLTSQNVQVSPGKPWYGFGASSHRNTDVAQN